MRSTVAVLAGLALFAGPIEARAQARFEITPTLGYYTPLADVISESGFSPLRQDGTTAFGARATIWSSAQVGWDLSVAYARSGVNDGGSVDTHGHLLLSSLRLLYKLSQGTTRCLETQGGCYPSVYLAAGIGLVSRGGAAWQNSDGSSIDGTTNLTGDLGAGLRIPAGHLAVRIEGEVHLYSASFTPQSTGTATQSQFQKDLILSIGLAIPLASGR